MKGEGMNRTTGGVIGLVVVVVLGIGLFFALDNNETTDQQATQTEQTEQTEMSENTDMDAANDVENEEAATSGTVIVTYTDDGFSPETIDRISVGDTVRFENNSTRSMWVASDEHPAHTDYPDFDQLMGVGVGETYSFTFTEPGEYDYHNHLAPGDVGTVIVQ